MINVFHNYFIYFLVILGGGNGIANCYIVRNNVIYDQYMLLTPSYNFSYSERKVWFYVFSLVVFHTLEV